METIKATFIEKLKTIYHTRISYPELNKNGKAEEEKTDKETTKADNNAPSPTEIKK